MEQISNEIRIGYSDPDINAILDKIGGKTHPFTRHFSQGEEFFLKLEEEFAVPHFPIHHDVRNPKPSEEYLGILKTVMNQLARLAPQVFGDLAYFFDPSEIMRPCFYKIYRIEDSHYLYMLRLDLMIKSTDSTVIERGTNDITAHYSSRKLFLETVVIPLAEVVRSDGRIKALKIKQTISQTWIGESGRGYFVQGIWMDMDLTKFFSKLFLPKGRRIYPYYPYLCKYKTVCQSVIELSSEGRKANIPYLHRAIQFLSPLIEKIQSALKNTSFSEELGIFLELKTKVPEAWYAPWKGIRLEAYLNESDMKEFLIEN